MSLELKCLRCKKTQTVPITNKQLLSWQCGSPIQNVAPNLDAGQRELLISGVCGRCFDNMYAEEEAGQYKGDERKLGSPPSDDDILPF